MANPRVYAGFSKRYDGKIVYVISTAKDTDTGEETVIFFNYDYFTVINCYTYATTRNDELVKQLNQFVGA